MNRINQLYKEQQDPALAIYFTAGYPALNDTRRILRSLQQSGADLIEIGMPFSDPIADGPTIQATNMQALENGMTIDTLFNQLEGMREEVQVPVVLMGYLNPVMQYGIEKFCKRCQTVGIDGLILPDLPLYEYESQYKALFEHYGLRNIFLITPQTREERIRKIDAVSDGFIYMVAAAGVTGAKSGLQDEQLAYFERIQKMELQNPRMIGFGISDHDSFSRASSYGQGAIIGSAFLKVLSESQNLEAYIAAFIKRIKEPKHTTA